MTGKQLPRPRRSFAGAVLGKKYYLVGGLGADMKIVAPVDVFDFESGQWSSIAAPEPRLFAELAELGGKLYLAGGYAASEDGHFEPAESIEVYDPATDAWSTARQNTACSGGRLEGQVRSRAGCCSFHLIAIIQDRAAWRSCALKYRKGSTEWDSSRVRREWSWALRMISASPGPSPRSSWPRAPKWVSPTCRATRWSAGFASWPSRSAPS